MAEPGRRLLGGRYELDTLLATGGQGQVWRARDTVLSRRVAVKVLRSEFTGDPTFLARFRAEAQHAALVTHRHIAALFDYGELDDAQTGERLAFLVMELVDGESLADLLARERRLPAPRTLAAQLWALRNGGLDQRGLDEIAHLAGSGRTSIKVDPEIAKGLYRAAGFRVCGERAVRVDILERLADLIRPAIAYRPGTTAGEPPLGAADGEGFVGTVGMTSLVGCSGEDFASILRSLGYVSETRPGPAITVPLVPAASTEPAARATPPEAPVSASVETPEAEAAQGEDAPAAELTGSYRA